MFFRYSHVCVEFKKKNEKGVLNVIHQFFVYVINNNNAKNSIYKNGSLKWKSTLLTKSAKIVKTVKIAFGDNFTSKRKFESCLLSIHIHKVYLDRLLL